MPFMLIQPWFHANFSVYTLFKIFLNVFLVNFNYEQLYHMDMPIEFHWFVLKNLFKHSAQLYHAHMLRKFNIKVLFRERSSCKIKI